MKPPYELGDKVRPSSSYMLWCRKRNIDKLSEHSVGKVSGFRAPTKVSGVHIGQVMVDWPVKGSTGVFTTVKMRWDQIEPM